MTFPAGIETVVVTLGTFTSQAGDNNYSGSITFTPRSPRYHLLTKTPLPATPIPVSLKGGQAQVTLVASDASGCDVTDVQYDVKFDLRGPKNERITFSDRTIYLTAGESPYDLDSMAGVDPADPTGVVVTGAARDVEVVHLAGAETITGPKVFTAAPIVPTPTDGGHAANKAYVDAHAGSGGGGTAPDATTGSKGIVRLAGDLAGSADAPTVPGLTGKADKASPALSGTPTAPTAGVGTNTTQLATTAFVRGEVAGLVGSAPSALDTLNELAAALGNDPNLATSLNASLGAKAPLASPNLTGTPTAPNPASGANTNQVATAAFVTGAVAGLAQDAGVVHVASAETISGVKTFGSSPTVPTPTATGHAANKAYVDAAATGSGALRTVTGTDDTLLAADAGKIVLCTNASGVTVTVPPNSSVALPVGSKLSVAQLGAGQVTLAAGAGVTLDNPRGLKTALRYSELTLRKVGTDEWLIGGDAKAASSISGFGTATFATSPFGS